MSKSRVLYVTLVCAVLVPMVLLAGHLALRSYLAEGYQRAEATLRLTQQAMEGRLLRYQAIPDLLAGIDDVQALAARPGDAVRVRAMNLWLHEKNALLESSDIYVIAPDGVTIAASNHDRADSFIGQNFSYRPYFTDALSGRPGRFFAIGTTSGVRGYYFSAPIRGQDGAITGVVVVKIGLDVIEAEWRGQGSPIMVTDPEGIVFLSSDPGWLYQGLLPLTPERLARTAQWRRYADVVPVVLPHDERVDQGFALLRLHGQDGHSRDYLEAAAFMPLAGWTVHVLLDTAPLRAQARLAFAALVLLLGIGVSVMLMIWQRRARLAERIALQEDAKAQLERRVDERTADLARVNHQIETEVAERRLTEQELRRTQADLVQAGKLAALGQMSAALSHEINQPLAAARNYADSATILLDRGDGVRARENVTQIVALIDRMAAIARHLRHVARKPDAPLQDVALAPALVEAVQVAEVRLAAAGVAVVFDLDADLPRVRAGPVRLQQVLVNMLSNACDAMEGATVRRVEVSGRVDAGRVLLAVRDHGPGVAAAIADRIFDPFFTTKRVGSGLGLGLSISYNIMKDFGGDLRMANHPEGGAVFTLVLEAVGVRAVAAE